MTFANRGGFRSARSTRPATISNQARRPSSIAPPYLKGPSKEQLREELATAARNTVVRRKVSKHYGAKDYPL